MSNTFKDIEFKHNIKHNIIHAAQLLLPMLEPDQRVEFFDNIMMNYCHHCGVIATNHNPCFCQNDE